MPCEDDEDLCDVGSGSAPGSYDSREYDSQNNVFGNMKHHDISSSQSVSEGGLMKIWFGLFMFCWMFN